ncbi:hypothetical protein TIFTF001_008589 [Ficus carica]|uniref:Uncharacterized protein n=1 Tax=Ficus carica TaxID=3494 RepID=A0AA87ZSR4_FICCA|nr:hypothetical protein TIFTF001_008589 [Ficus carica]
MFSMNRGSSSGVSDLGMGGELLKPSSPGFIGTRLGLEREREGERNTNGVWSERDMEKWESETGDIRKDGVADKVFDKNLIRVERRWKLATVEVTVASLGIPSHRITVQGKSG